MKLQFFSNGYKAKSTYAKSARLDQRVDALHAFTFCTQWYKMAQCI